MKNKKQYLYLAMLAVLLPTMSMSQTSEVKIDDVLPVEGGVEKEEKSPNLWLTLDDSGSMTNQINYNNNFTYALPVDVDGTPLPMPPRNIVYMDPFRNFRRGSQDARTTGNYCFNRFRSNEANCRIWFSYYRTRMLTLKSSLSLALFNNRAALEQVQARFGYQTLNGNSDLGRGRARHVVPVLPWSRKQKVGNDVSIVRNRDKQNQVYDWLFSLRASSGTPLRQVYANIINDIVRSVQTLNKDNPFVLIPDQRPTGNLNQPSGDNPILSCRRNYNILLTDGGWNTSSNRNVASTLRRSVWSNGARFVNSPMTLPDGVAYNAYPPFRNQELNPGDRRGNASPTLGDMAFSAWAYDLDNIASTNTLSPRQDVYDFFDGSQYGRKVYNNTNPAVPDSERVYWHPYNDLANWQHINTYTIGFGLSQARTPGVNVNPPRDQIEALNNTTLANDVSKYIDGTNNAWPVITVGNQITSNYTLSDLANAAVAGRGKFYNVTTPNTLQSAFSDIFNDAGTPPPSSTSNSGSGGSVSAGNTGSNLFYFIAKYDPSTFAGNLFKYRLYSPDVDFDFTSGCWEGDNQTRYVQSGRVLAPVGTPCDIASPTGGAQENLRDDSDRGIIFTSRVKDVGTNTELEQAVKDGKPLIKEKLEFTDSTVSTAQIQYLDFTGDLINYIRGDHSNEQSNGGGSYRNRAASINDSTKVALSNIGRSNPTFIGVPNLSSAHPAFKDTSSGLYTGFMEFRNRFKSSFGADGGYVFAGSNGGMMHVFDADLKEKFAYVPHSIYKTLPNIIKPDEYHSYVDGEFTITPIFNDSNEWRYSLTSGMGPGGKGVFAMDMQEPDLNSMTVWEYSELESRSYNSSTKTVKATMGQKDDLSTVGNILGAPSYTMLSDGTWAVVTGNGYNSERNKAALLVLNALTGEVIQELVLDNKYTDDDLPNGLGPITQVSYGGKDLATDDLASLKTDRVYAGDLQGNLWIFDFTKATKDCDGSPDSCVTVATTTAEQVPILQARDLNGKSQPITVAPYVTRHVTGYGFMIQVGTGSLFSRVDLSVYTPGDADTSVINSIYGIWDDWVPSSIAQGGGLDDPRTDEVMDFDRNADKDLRKIELVEGTTTTSSGETATVRVLPDNLPPTKWKVSDTIGDFRGWYIDLRERERSWQTPIKQYGAGGAVGVGYVTVTYPVESSASQDIDLVCELTVEEPTSSKIILDEFDASRTLKGSGALDIDSDGSITADDKVSNFSGTGTGTVSDIKPGTSIDSSGVTLLGGSFTSSSVSKTGAVGNCIGQSITRLTASGGDEGLTASTSCLTRIPGSWVELK